MRKTELEFGAVWKGKKQLSKTPNELRNRINLETM